MNEIYCFIGAHLQFVYNKNYSHSPFLKASRQNASKIKYRAVIKCLPNEGLPPNQINKRPSHKETT